MKCEETKRFCVFQHREHVDVETHTHARTTIHTPHTESEIEIERKEGGAALLLRLTYLTFVRE